ncbi:MAG TPA: efflux transporter outer membrane subunit [Hyphomicrobiales bacterium]|nr:efflux transporter outer membrane subunit [Hyphomicrobiales bacterium]
MLEHKDYAAGRTGFASKLSYAASFVTALLLQSCVGPDFQVPAPPEISKFTSETLPAGNSAGGKTQHLDIGRELPANWWALFHSTQLNSLIARALRDNPNIDAARAALRVAQANVYAEVGQLFPLATGNYEGQGGKVATQPSGPGVAAPVVGPNGVNPSYYTLHTAQLTVSYVPDVWGGVRRQIENLEALKESQRFMNEATFLTLTSNIAAGAIQEASLRGQIRVTERLIVIAKEILAKIRAQKEAGQVSGLDVAAQEALVAQTEATLPPLRKALAQQRDALTVLSGHLPGEELPEHFEFTELKLPRHVPLSLPSDLVSQRPDVRAAEANFHAACALIGVAVANRLPQFTLTGNTGRSAINFNNLFSSNPAFYFYTGIFNATQTLFDGFTLQQRQRAAEAGFDQAAAQYRLAVLTAFQNVADALYAIRHDTVALQKALLAEKATLQTLNLTRIQLAQGQVAIQTVLGAQTTYLQASLTVIQAQANRYADTVALFQALGGGWWNRDAPPPPPEPQSWFISVLGAKPNPLEVTYPGATANEVRKCEDVSRESCPK